MTNQLCECPAAGFCARHGVHKSPREHQLCQGVNCTAQQSAKYWNAWEEGRLSNQPAAPEAAIPFDAQALPPGIPPHVVRGLGDKIAQWTSWFGVTPCGGCKDRAALLNHWFPADLAPVEPVKFTAPVRHLMFHIWPVQGFGAWQWNCDELLARAHLFNGRRIVAIATDGETDSADAVRDYLREFTDEFLIVRNDTGLREVATWLPMLERLEPYQSDQDLLFACHAKGVRHKFTPDHAGSTVFRWTAAMYQTCLDDWAEVAELLTTHALAGSFRRYMTPETQGWGVWHYSGTYFWARLRDVFARNWRYIPKRFYGTEAWPGLMFRPDEAAVIFGEAVADLYDLDYWDRMIVPALAEWTSKHG